LLKRHVSAALSWCGKPMRQRCEMCGLSCGAEWPPGPGFEEGLMRFQQHWESCEGVKRSESNRGEWSLEGDVVVRRLMQHRGTLWPWPFDNFEAEDLLEDAQLWLDDHPQFVESFHAVDSKLYAWASRAACILFAEAVKDVPPATVVSQLNAALEENAAACSQDMVQGWLDAGRHGHVSEEAAGLEDHIAKIVKWLGCRTPHWPGNPAWKCAHCPLQQSWPAESDLRTMEPICSVESARLHHTGDCDHAATLALHRQGGAGQWSTHGQEIVSRIFQHKALPRLDEQLRERNQLLPYMDSIPKIEHQQLYPPRRATS